MEKRALLASALAILILIAWQVFFAPAPPRPKVEKPEETPAAPPATGPKPAALVPPRRPPVAVRQPQREEQIRLETDLLQVTLTNQGGAVLSWRIRRYTDEAGQPLDLAPARAAGEPPLSLAAWVEGGQGPDQLLEVVSRPSGVPGEPQAVLFRTAERGGLIVEKRLTLHPGKYQADLDLRLVNAGAGATTPSLRVAWGPGFRGAAKDAATHGGQA
ncbi:MAG TPA: membrane protein insertase YidC, partial [Candidatus Methylomirabilis sp.]|nr:membrane protein insertase YidC [Candidatus Methylomirabilis sp.]